MRIHFVVNPRAGKVQYRRLAAAIEREFAGHDISITPDVSDPAFLMRSGRPALVVAVGGDGTVNRVVNALAIPHGPASQQSVSSQHPLTMTPNPIPVGIIPRGTSNDLARALGIPCDFSRACEVIKRARLTAIDLIEVNSTRFATCGGLGLPAAIAARANDWRTNLVCLAHWAPRLGRTIYSVAALHELCRRVRPFALIISNLPRFGGFCASPQASPRDGLLHLCCIAVPRTRLRMLWIACLALLGRADRCQEVSLSRERALTVMADQPVSFLGDGEILAHGDRFAIRILPRALRVAAPRGEIAWGWHVLRADPAHTDQSSAAKTSEVGHG